MNALSKGKNIFEWWRTEREKIELEAKENGIWQYCGLDANNHLFVEVDIKAKERLKELHTKK